ncbi:DNA fragmentation factor subunit alpha-like [Octopus vulgaris]|uniref:DNAation factor subunit alpha-like n=1 Tax=Octopus vulgaris TaxID=6645 RepID=A0AA36AWN7_OCTVU|nr:DNA fragmentation factor subunit alpha-like [Octopus vulgaris]
MSQTPNQNAKAFKIWNSERTTKKPVVASNLQDLVLKGKLKLGLTTGTDIRLVLEADGTDVDDEDYFALLPNDTVFVLLESDERWHSANEGYGGKDVKAIKNSAKDINSDVPVVTSVTQPAISVASASPIDVASPALPLPPVWSNPPSTVSIGSTTNGSTPIASESVQLPEESSFTSKNGINIADFKKDAYQWNEQSTRLFIELYKHYHELFLQPNIKKKNLWEEISKKMLEYGFEISARQCENKWKSLKLSFKKVEEYNRNSGLKRKCSFYDEISEILGQSNVISISLASTSSNSATEILESSTEKVRRFKPKRPRSSECSTMDILNWLKANKEEEKRQQEEDRLEMRKMHEEKMKAFYSFLDVLKKWKS